MLYVTTKSRLYEFWLILKCVDSRKFLNKSKIKMYNNIINLYDYYDGYDQFVVVESSCLYQVV